MENAGGLRPPALVATQVQILLLAFTARKGSENANSAGFIGCCGAYCKTCKAYTEGSCKGCKLGYGEGKRDISKARCAIKVCCFGKKKLETCADCPAYSKCSILQGFYGKNGYKYKKYKEATEFIRKNGYSAFLEKAEEWKGACGKLK